jgi:pyruvate carboxylase subunit B
VKKDVDVMITAFRDGFQSVYGARVLTEDFMPAVEAGREAGFDHFEAGGERGSSPSIFTATKTPLP